MPLHSSNVTGYKEPQKTSRPQNTRLCWQRKVKNYPLPPPSCLMQMLCQRRQSGGVFRSLYQKSKTALKMLKPLVTKFDFDQLGVFDEGGVGNSVWLPQGAKFLLPYCIAGTINVVARALLVYFKHFYATSPPFKVVYS